jgi:hypothetical protein
MMNEKSVLDTIRYDFRGTNVPVRKSNGVYLRVGSKKSRIEFTKTQGGLRRGFYGFRRSACSINAGPGSFNWGDAIYSYGDFKQAETFGGCFCGKAASDPFDFSKIGYETGAKEL